MPRGTTTRNAATNSVAYVNARSRISIHRSTHDARRTTLARSRQLPDHVVAGLGPAIAGELPRAPDLLVHVGGHLRADYPVLVFAAPPQVVPASIPDVAPHVVRP